ncbi:hypothetical protein CRUP_037415 [Coryphaenoides rupestris]|nr:hypothetical protein CRUP_037415 [Coryphaenoides rupestris]
MEIDSVVLRRVVTTEGLQEAGGGRAPCSAVTSAETGGRTPAAMGCTAGHLACQSQSQSQSQSRSQAASGQEGQSLESGGGAPKVPEVLSSLERLSQATGGMEKSWYRCIFPFGIISLVIGVAGTGVTYSYNDLPQTKVVARSEGPRGGGGGGGAGSCRGSRGQGSGAWRVTPGRGARAEPKDDHPTPQRKAERAGGVIRSSCDTAAMP